MIDANVMRESQPVSHLGWDWASLWKRHGQWLRALMFARLGDVHAVEDVEQDLALAVASQADRSSPGDHSFNDGQRAAWLRRVALRQVLIYRRKAGRRSRHVAQFAEETRHQNDPEAYAERRNPLEILLLDERREVVREGLKRLPPRETELLVLKYAEGWSYREIADRLGLSESAVETRLHRARANLRKVLKSHSSFQADES